MILALFVLNRHQLKDNNSLFPFIHCFKTRVGLLSSDQWLLDPLGYGHVSSLGHVFASQRVQCSLALDISCFLKTKHKLKDNVSLFSLVYYFKTFPLFSFNIIWFLSSWTSHSLYTYDHSHSCHPILIHMKLIKLSKPRRMSLSFNLSSTPSQPHGSSSSPFSCLLL